MKNNRLDETKIGNAKVTVETLGKGHCIPNTKITPQYITIHNTGNWDAPAKNNHNYLKNLNKNGGRTASWHFTVDDIEIYQSQSTNYKCYHAGDSTGNNISIGIEICQFKDKDKQLKAYKNAIELVKILIKYHNFDISKVVQHNYWSGKDCPSLLRSNTYGYNWNWFISEVKSVESKNGWIKEKNKWYYYKEGVKVTGWIKDDSKWYYLKSDGEMATGWEKVNGTWYYLDESGSMATGWIKDNDKWYFLDSSGAMVTGWLKESNKWYYLRSNGAMETGLLQLGNKLYFLKDNGELVVNKKIEINNDGEITFI